MVRKEDGAKGERGCKQRDEIIREIAYLCNHSVSVEQHIHALEVPMHDISRMKKFHCFRDVDSYLHLRVELQVHGLVLQNLKEVHIEKFCDYICVATKRGKDKKKETLVNEQSNYHLPTYC